jgi:hypothetical protein
MRIKKGPYLFIIMLLACTTGMAQMGGPFSMSPIATSGAIVSNGGSPIVMNGTEKCLNVSSGLSTMNINNNAKGVYGASCIETPPAAILVSIKSLNVYPNPTHSTSTLKCEGQFDVNLSCQVRIMSMDGKMMMSQMVSMKDVQAGYTINASSYAAGTYVVNVNFMNQNYNIKLIKL